MQMSYAKQQTQCDLAPLQPQIVFFSAIITWLLYLTENWAFPRILAFSIPSIAIETILALSLGFLLPQKKSTYYLCRSEIFLHERLNLSFAKIKCVRNTFNIYCSCLYPIHYIQEVAWATRIGNPTFLCACIFVYMLLWSFWFKNLVSLAFL